LFPSSLCKYFFSFYSVAHIVLSKKSLIIEAISLLLLDTKGEGIGFYT
jgi:hypothetical protein